MTETSPENTQTPESLAVGQGPKPRPRGMGQRSAADFLTNDCGYPIAEKTLQKRRCVGGGPPYRKINGHVIYEPPDLIAWADEQLARSPLVTSTSEYDD